MKILLIASLAESLVNFRGPLIRAFQEKGLEVHVASPDIPPLSLTRKQLERMGVHVHQVPMLRTGTNPIADLRTTLSLWWMMRKIQPSMVLSYTVKPVIYGTLAAWLAGVTRRFALITGLGFTFQAEGERGMLRLLVQHLYRWALARAELVFFQNPDDLALFQKLGILQPQTMTCVVNGSGVSLDSFAMKPLLTSQLERVRFLFIGRFLGDKGIREYVSAARLVQQRYPQAQFALVGWIDTNPNSISQDELDGWIDEGCIDFQGFLEDVRPAIEACSVYVLPSYREGTPRTVLEAMAIGRAIITTDAPGCRETVVDGYNGYLIPIKNAEALAQAMLRFIEQPSLLVTMGERSRKIAESKYDVHKVNALMLGKMGVK